MIRLGLCCIFREAPIKFRRSTAAVQTRYPQVEQRQRLAALCKHNADSLAQALAYCRDAGIGAFRINSQILPLITHPQIGYRISDLPGYKEIVDRFRQCGAFARRNNIRTSFHPDQFVVIASPRPEVREKSMAELAYQAMLAEWVGADVINIHGGGAYGDKSASLRRLTDVITGLPADIKRRITLENDDRTFSPADLLPVCRQTGIPLVYDVHHHRCLPDDLSVTEATRKALETWSREPLFHLSSPMENFSKGVDRRHADYIDPADFPAAWHDLDITVELEAKAKELAVAKLKNDLKAMVVITCQ